MPGVRGLVFLSSSKLVRDVYCFLVLLVLGLVGLFSCTMGIVLLSGLKCFVVFCSASLLQPWVVFSTGLFRCLNLGLLFCSYRFVFCVGVIPFSFSYRHFAGGLGWHCIVVWLVRGVFF